MKVESFVILKIFVSEMPPSLKSVATLTSLPALVLEKIFLYLSYEEVAHLRLVSHLFNYTCMSLI